MERDGIHVGEDDLWNIGEIFMKSLNCVIVSKVLKKKLFKEDFVPSIFNSKPKQEESSWGGQQDAV